MRGEQSEGALHRLSPDGTPVPVEQALLGSHFAVGVWASNHIGRSGEKDSSAIVIDEVAGQWLTLAVVAVDWRYYVIGFFLFRLADIAKPWPASWADRRVPGGLGVMLDDIFAGLYAALALWLISRWLGYGPWLTIPG